MFYSEIRDPRVFVEKVSYIKSVYNDSMYSFKFGFFGYLDKFENLFKKGTMKVSLYLDFPTDTVSYFLADQSYSNAINIQVRTDSSLSLEGSIKVNLGNYSDFYNFTSIVSLSEDLIEDSYY